MGESSDQPDTGVPEGALGDLRILDFSRVLAGPFATMLLADLGATVIKVERPGSGDDTRAWGPPFDARGVATYFDSVNRNKDSITLDLSGEAGRSQARQLASQSDVVVENFRPGLMESLGLDYQRLSRENPGLIYCSITGFGRDAGAALPGYDLLIQALGGLMSITGDPDGEPQKVGVALVDVLSGLFATVGILAALRERERSGRGQLVEVNLLSSLLAAMVNQSAAFTAGGVVPQRMGNAHPSIAPYAPFQTGEGEIVLAVGNDRQFGSLCSVLGSDQLAADPRFATNPARVAHRQELAVELEARLRDRPAAEWVLLLNRERVPAGMINDIAGAFALAERLGLNPLVELRAGDGGEDGQAVRLPRNPIGLSRTPPTYRSAPPAMG